MTAIRILERETRPQLEFSSFLCPPPCWIGSRYWICSLSQENQWDKIRVQVGREHHCCDEAVKSLCPWKDIYFIRSWRHLRRELEYPVILKRYTNLRTSIFKQSGDPA